MSALKNFQFNEDEDGELPTLVTGEEPDLKNILNKSHSDGGNLVTMEKVDRVNRQNEMVKNSMKYDNSVSSSISSHKRRIPVTIITGYLGSGKSTLLEKIALKGSDKKIAIIMNEFGDSSEIEKAMTIRNGEASYQEWLDLGNGCLCCSLKNIGVKAIEDMVERSPGMIDYILLETSGIADPAPIARMFWQDEGLNSSVYIDGVITVLDAEHILKCLDDVSPDAHWHGEKVSVPLKKEEEEKEEKHIEDGNNLTIAHFQIAMADRILLNKVDRLREKPDEIEIIKSRIQEINSLALLYETQYGEVSIENILDLHAYESFNAMDKYMTSNVKTLHDPRMSTIVLNFRKLKSKDEFDTFIKGFLQVLLWKNFGVDDYKIQKWEIQRTKGIISYIDNNCKGQIRSKIIQGVRDTYDIFDNEKTGTSEECKLVLIGKYLDEKLIKNLLNSIIC
ncbi:GTP-dependent zinc transferase PWA37_000511 [Arxiozyma heterogenica]|uniref:CobW/HypB/UreG nucleotide-binding domain-containing protein n=1 Tax=Arxiozyma heterogenica TaxID=278026 RepID=A0AAN7ZX49_9SACH|nr:hypothetical protein RI543_003905 [Kazachstania heterogenica]